MKSHIFLTSRHQDGFWPYLQSLDVFNSEMYILGLENESKIIKIKVMSMSVIVMGVFNRWIYRQFSVCNVKMFQCGSFQL